MGNWNTLTDELVRQLQQRVGQLDEQQQKLAKWCVTLTGEFHASYEPEIQQALQHELQRIAAQQPQQLFAPLLPIVQHLSGEVAAQQLDYIIKHTAEYPYSVGYMRRPYRTSNLLLHMDQVINKMLSLIRLHGFGFTLTQYLTAPDYDLVEPYMLSREIVIPDLIAYALDQQDQTVHDALLTIIHGDNQNALLARPMIKGMLMSHRTEAHQSISDLLLAARLQEGLRQSITEVMDEGTVDSMRGLLHTILEHNLIRYSSVVRALDVWTGMNLEAANTRVAGQVITQLYEVLCDASLRQEWLSSENANHIYLALWAIAVHEEDNVPAALEQVIHSGLRYRKIIGLYVLGNSQNTELRLAIARQLLQESAIQPAEDPELLYRIVYNYAYGCEYVWDFVGDSKESERLLRIRRTPQLESKSQRARDFATFRALLDGMPGSSLAGASSVLDFASYQLDHDLLIDKLLYLASYDNDPAWMEQVLQYKDKMSPDLRGNILEYVIRDGNDPAQRRFVLEALADKSMSNREKALHCATHFVLRADELQRIEDLFKLKTGSLRQGGIRILLSQPEEMLDPVLPRLLHGKSELQRLAGLEMLTELQGLPERQEQLARLIGLTEVIQSPTAKEQLLLDKLHTANDAPTYTAANGFGLFDPQQTEAWLQEPVDTKGFRFDRDMFQMSTERIASILQGLDELVHEHRNVEYDIRHYGGYTSQYLIGSRLMMMNMDTNDEQTSMLEQFPLVHVWREFLQRYQLTPQELLELHVHYQLYDSLFQYYDTSSGTFSQLPGWWNYRGTNLKELQQWLKPFLASVYPLEHLLTVTDYYAKQTYPQQTSMLLWAAFNDVRNDDTWQTVRFALHTWCTAITAKEVQEHTHICEVLLSPWIRLLHNDHISEKQFKDVFQTRYQTEQTIVGLFDLNAPADYGRAHQLHLIEDNEVYRRILSQSDSRRDYMRALTTIYSRNNLVEKYPNLLPIRDHTVARILDIELKRGELPTEVSYMAANIERFYGMHYFVDILVRLDRETFIRGYIYNSGNSSTKKEIFSQLLKRCYPIQGEDEALLAQLLNQQPVPERRLLEAAMYAPQWIEIVARHLNWNGLRSAAWYFHAHINETFSAEKETIVAHYSPITPQQFNDGAFDLNWFQQAYDELGAERFKLLYECAKYISGGSNHRRSQLFADAVLGKLNVEQTRQQVEDKRNKDQLLTYSLIPLAEGNSHDADLRARYEYIQLFLKQSKAFGAQRRASESSAAAIALDNLARNAGYTDVTRLKWDLEARKLDELLPYFTDHEVEDGLLVRLDIDSEGQASLLAAKNGKPLKSVPARLNKHDYIIRLKELKSELTDQYKRAREELERSMLAETVFTASEIATLLRNPVLSPLFTALVLRKTDGSALGYISGHTEHEQQAPLQLVAPTASADASATTAIVDNTAKDHQPDDIQAGYALTSVPLLPEDELVIAHPLHLYESGTWHLFQRHLIEKQFWLQQQDRGNKQQREPFKQVFRELYLPNADEKSSNTISRRYAGHQVQPGKTTALLRGRGWTVSYEEGLQKVDYRHNLITSLYALADWFSPADTEAPTLETVSFYDRSSYKPVSLDQVPPIVFSEVMRDIDLVVSVAHVGGVDPEASLTTIELRSVIVEEAVRLLKLDNVKISGNYAHITGKLGEYNVHLGSANVSRPAADSLYIIPVHSQHRGRLFLPFIDEDPRTAEIVSKVLLLAEDHKIKDPQILEQINNGSR
ncbi:DUF4132 domain-containing protein [Paenibacillus sp. WLX1005]|uniref:DUF4132 domain-containing protein n=1 Tax=Paenibacillus sp. WLX1005 TaxID=3243766 RepID=UPI003984072B